MDTQAKMVQVMLLSVVVHVNFHYIIICSVPKVISSNAMRIYSLFKDVLL